MVRYNPKTWFSLIFHAYSRQVMRTLMPALLFMAIYTGALAYLDLDYFKWNFKSTTAVHSLLGIVLGLFLVFRVNSAYDRWWEGRKFWGSLVNNTRNLALKLGGFLPEDDRENRSYFAQMIPNFVAALKEHLRKGVDMNDLDLIEEEDFLKRLKGKEHIPNIITLMLYKKVNELYKKKIITGDHFFVLDKEIKSFSDIMGGCERIKNTPIPYSYSMYVKKFIFTYTITLPFAFIHEFHYWTVPIVLLIFYVLISVEIIAEEIEDPFGKDVNDLPTDDLTEKIKKNVREILID
ncbi:bestrophin [Fulvivirga sp. M361]|uniref:bestrophin family protein n=1 Tax=Fulvivirga sp. M361 TaxID=2594266 RepID=UPI00117A462B|nr:bestrophin family ion channel [Fulvivirga sp. M361]TRX62100.1 bestrophin [Fulvivirga sp. M361]